MQVEAEGDVATAFTLARILSNIPLSRGGPASVVIFDIHALQVCHSSSLVAVRQPCAVNDTTLRSLTCLQGVTPGRYAEKQDICIYTELQACSSYGLLQQQQCCNCMLRS